MAAELAVVKAPLANDEPEFATPYEALALANAPLANDSPEAADAVADVFCDVPSANFNGFATKFTPSVEIFT